METSPADVNIFQIAAQSRLSANLTTANLTTTNTQLLEIACWLGKHWLGRHQGKKFALNWPG